MNERRGKEYTESLRQEAFNIVAGRKYLEGGHAEYRALAMELVRRKGCAYATARQHITYAFMRNRDPDFKQPEWGGARDGAGWPAGRARK